MRINTLTAADYRALQAGRTRKPSKYRNKKVVMPDGTVIDSKKEAGRVSQLRLMERAGEIFDLELQPAYPLVVNGVKVAVYKADARYKTKTGLIVIEDVKGLKTQVYRIKKKLFEACYRGLTITEV